MHLSVQNANDGRLHADGAVILIPQKVQAVARLAVCPADRAGSNSFTSMVLGRRSGFSPARLPGHPEIQVVHQCHPQIAVSLSAFRIKQKLLGRIIRRGSCRYPMVWFSSYTQSRMLLGTRLPAPPRTALPVQEQHQRQREIPRPPIRPRDPAEQRAGRALQQIRRQRCS